MRLVFDIEANGLLDEADRLWCWAAQDPDTGETYSGTKPKELFNLLRKADTVIGHNIQDYDLQLLKKLHGFEFEGTVRDTYIMSKVCWPDLKKRDFARRAAAEAMGMDPNKRIPGELVGRHKLEAWGWRLEVYKDDFHKKEDAWLTWDPAMLDYCIQDVELNVALFKLIESKQLPELVWEIEHPFAWHIEHSRKGFYFDKAKGEALERELDIRRSRIANELREAFPDRVEEMKTPQYYEDPMGNRYERKKDAPSKVRKELKDGPPKVKYHPFNPSSNIQIEQRFNDKYGWRAGSRTATGDPEITERVLESVSFPEAALLLELRMLDDRLEKLSRGRHPYLGNLGSSQRLRGWVDHMGTVTSRCTHGRPHLGQVPKHPKPYGREFRELFTVPEARALVGWDASGLELRALAHWMNDEEYTRQILEGDIHTYNQKAAGLETRDQAKTFIYALLYGAGDSKIGSIVGGKSKAGKELKAKFFDSLPKLKKLSRRVTREFEEKGYVTTLDGRQVPVHSDHVALNCLLQSTGAIAMKKATNLFCDALPDVDPSAFMVAHVHDEIQTETDPDRAQLVGDLGVHSIRQAGEFFNLNCPLDGEAKIGKDWSETH
jgi:hypothetical protein